MQDFVTRIPKYCRLIGKSVTFRSSPDRAVSDVDCPEYETATCACRLKREAQESGRLSLLQSIANEGALDGALECRLR